MEQSYKEKYEDILARLAKAKNDNEVCDERFCCVINEIIPELAESEDEKIRKELIDAVQGLWDNDALPMPLSVKRKDKWLAWLEKQGTPAKLGEEEQNKLAKVVLTSCASSFIDYLDAHKYEGKMCVSNGECEDIENAFHNAMWDRLHRYYCKYIEKQAEVKESTIFQHENRTCEENDDFLTSDGEVTRKEIINYFRCQSEEEPTRKEIHNKWIAWLENIPYTIDHEKREGFHLGYKACLEKQGEQKFEMKTAEESLGIDSDTYNKIVDECIFDEQKPADKVEPKFKVGEKELTNEELCEGLIRGMVNEHNRVTKEVLRTEYEKGRADVLAKIDAIDVDEMVCESGATSRVTQYWYAHGVNDVIKKLKEEQV